MFELGWFSYVLHKHTCITGKSITNNTVLTVNLLLLLGISIVVLNLHKQLVWFQLKYLIANDEWNLSCLMSGKHSFGFFCLVLVVVNNVKVIRQPNITAIKLIHSKSAYNLAVLQKYQFPCDFPGPASWWAQTVINYFFKTLSFHSFISTCSVFIDRFTVCNSIIIIIISGYELICFCVR